MIIVPRVVLSEIDNLKMTFYIIVNYQSSFERSFVAEINALRPSVRLLLTKYNYQMSVTFKGIEYYVKVVIEKDYLLTLSFLLKQSIQNGQGCILMHFPAYLQTVLAYQVA
jgi:hypothetical protein